MSISGLHITLLAWLFARAIGYFWRWSAHTGSTLCLRWPSPLVSAWGGAVLATFYALFSGWGLPAQRTIVMLWVIVLVQNLGLRWPGLWTWTLAFWVLVVWDPWALLQAGFWLSFVAVGALMLGRSEHTSERTKMRPDGLELVQESGLKRLRLNVGKSTWHGFVALAKEQWIVVLALTPLSVLFFGQISLVGLLANFVAIPWVTWVVTPLAMLGLLYAPLWQLALLTLQPLMVLLEFLHLIPGSVWVMPVPRVLMAAIAVCGGLLMLQTWPWALRCWGVLLLLPAFLWQEPRPPKGHFDVWFADIGQGNAVVLRTANHALLYDTGPQYSENSDAGQRVLVPLMARMGIQLDRLILSHRDTDHTGGAAAVLDAQKQASVWASLEEGHPLSKVRPVNACLAGQKWTWDGVQFEFLHPTQSDYDTKTSSNALSCVLRVDVKQGSAQPIKDDVHPPGQASALLVGDIEAPQELALLQRGVLQAVDVLLVPHHGSQTSSTSSFIAMLKPHWAVVQAGYRNRYGHPAPQVVDRYESLGVRLVSTPECGAAYWQSIQPHAMVCERLSHKRYWHYRSH
jgi:competence protein ComEC